MNQHPNEVLSGKMTNAIDPAIYEFALYFNDAAEPDRTWTAAELVANSLDQLQSRDRVEGRGEHRLAALDSALATLLAAGYDDDGLDRLWMNTSARVMIYGDGAMREVFNYTRDAIRQRLRRRSDKQ